MKRSLFLSILILLIITVLSVTFLHAYFYEKDQFDDEDIIATVDVKADLYFIDDNNNRIEGEYSKILSDEQEEGYTKQGVYRVVLSSLTDDLRLSNLKVDFKVNSNIDTYFRIKIYDSIILKSVDGNRETVLTNTGIKYYFKDYGTNSYEEDDGDSEFWYFDKLSRWYYYKLPVNGLNDELNVPFIYGNTGYEGPTQNRHLEIMIIIEAVQAVRGPVENWGLNEKPWPNGGIWYEEENAD